MLKIEYIWRELLYRSIEEDNPSFTITELADRFSLSTSMVSYALAPLRDLSMIKIGKTASEVIDAEKLLFFWATRRNLSKDIIYQTYSPLTIMKIEASMPSDVISTAYSACRLYFDILPADYDQVYFYARDREEVAARFPESSQKRPNIFLLRTDPYLSIYRQIPIALVFVDLWNLGSWYAREFTQAVLARIKEKIGL